LFQENCELSALRIVERWVLPRAGEARSSKMRRNKYDPNKRNKSMTTAGRDSKRTGRHAKRAEKVEDLQQVMATRMQPRKLTRIYFRPAKLAWVDLGFGTSRATPRHPY